MDCSPIIIQILLGVSYGLLLFLLAAGLSLIFGLMGVINLAHGSFYMLGAYLGYSFYQATGNFLLALMAAGLAAAIIGIFIERCFFSQILNKELDQVLLAFGFIYIFMDICKWVWGGTPVLLPVPSAITGSLKIFGEAFPVYNLAVIFMSSLIALALWLLLEKSRLGLIIRAGVDDREMVTGLGININLYFTVIFALGAGLAALAGVIGGPIIGAYPGLDFEILVLALAIVVVGGLGTLKGAFWGSLLIGFLESSGKAFFPSCSQIIIYSAMAVILILKPQGLLGRGRLE